MLQNLGYCLAVDPKQATRSTLVHPINMARTTHPAIQIHGIHLPTLCALASGVRWRNFTPRRSDYPTDSVAILSPGFTGLVRDCPPEVTSCETIGSHLREHTEIAVNHLLPGLELLRSATRRTVTPLLDGQDVSY